MFGAWRKSSRRKAHKRELAQRTVIAQQYRTAPLPGGAVARPNSRTPGAIRHLDEHRPPQA